MDRPLAPSAATSAETVAEAGAAAAAGSANGGISAASRLSSHSSVGDEGRFDPGTILNGRYRILGLLGKGGMGEVYRATDLTLGQSVALKFLPQEASGNVRLLERFHAEVRVARQVSHPNVCRVYDIGEADGLPFISMEYIDGEDLASLLQRIGRLPSDKAMETARKICAGLASAHDKGVIHRDLKPHNIMLNKRGEVVIMDFGLAAVADSITGAEARNGTPAYMAPEQLKGSEVSARSDIYSLGLVLYELFTGKRPFEAKTIQTLLDQQEAQQLASMTSIAADVDPGVEKVIRRCLHPDPASRPATALQVAAALPGGDPLAAALAAGETPSPELVASAGKTEGMERRYSVPLIALIVACLVTVPFLLDRTSAINQSSLEFSPEVLRQKGREIAASFGYHKKPVDTEYWMRGRPQLIRYLNSQPEPHKWREWLASEAALITWQRESLSELIAPPAGIGVNGETPAPLGPGMTLIELDGHGRLRDFSGVPYEQGEYTGGAVPVETVFQAARLPFDKFTEVPAKSLPRSATDQLRAWKGPHPTIPNMELTLEVGWWKGQVTWVRFLWPWLNQQGRDQQSRSTASKVANAAALVMYLVAFTVAILLARRNWKLGRGDRRGATRIALFLLVGGTVHWICATHWVPSQQMVFLFFGGISDWLLGAGMMWLLYLALEPALRSRWPYAIVTWNRVLAGNWLDPQVSAHVLIGMAIGIGMWTAIAIQDAVGTMREGLNSGGSFWPLEGTREWIGYVAVNALSGLQTGLFGFFLMFGLRTLLRKDWIAAVVGAIGFAVLQVGANNPQNWGLSLGIYLIIFGGLIFAVLRVGLVATIAAVVSLNIMNAVVVGTDFSAWFVPRGLATALLLTAVAVLVFWRSLGTRDLLGGEEKGAIPAVHPVR